MEIISTFNSEILLDKKFNYKFYQTVNLTPSSTIWGLCTVANLVGGTGGWQGWGQEMGAGMGAVDGGSGCWH